MRAEIEQLIRRHSHAINASAPIVAAQKTPQALALEVLGPEAWLRRLGPHTFTGSFASFHHDLWNWYWAITAKRQRGEPLNDDELVFLAIWFRSGGKSSHAEWMAIAEGALLGYGFVMYLCNTEAQAKEHVASIRNRLESPLIAAHYPNLANPRIGKHGQQVAWRQDYLVTASGWGIIPVGLDQGMRGGRMGDLRFTQIILDDFDDLNESPAVTQKNLNTIARSVLPAGSRETIVVAAQNLIREDSGLNQIYTRRSDVLSERIVSGPVPAFEPDTLQLMLKDEGSRMWTIKHADPTWPDVDMTAARRFLARSGRAAFLAEYQHQFDDDKTELVLHNWRDPLHVITWSDFAKVYGRRSIPDRWNKYGFHDFARTKTQYHASVAGFVTTAAQSASLPGCIFMYEPMSFAAETETDDVGLRILKALAPQVRPGGGSWDELVRACVTRTGLDEYVTDATRLLAARREVLARAIPPLVQPILQRLHFQKWRMSHEAKTARAVLRNVYGLPFQAANPGADGGVDWLNHYMRVVEDAPDPFGRGGVVGAARFYLIVPDEKAAPPSALLPDALHDSDLVRYQFKRWRNRPEIINEAGAMEKGPVKMNDDFGNGLQMLMHDNCVSAAPLSDDERCEALLPLAQQLAVIGELSPEVQSAALAARDYRLRRISAQERAAERRGRFVNKHSFKVRR